MSASGLRSRRRWVLCAIVLGGLSAAPTPGDVGGCQPARPLDESAFFRAKRVVDCDRCQECGLVSDLCRRACDDERSSVEVFPARCAPLAQDGAVCLRALAAASCDDYTAYADDARPRVPSECDFCPSPEQAP